MQGHTNGHVHRSAVEWSSLIAQYRQSGLGMKEFCSQEGLTLQTFENWYRRVRLAALQALGALQHPRAIATSRHGSVRLWSNKLPRAPLTVARMIFAP